MLLTRCRLHGKAKAPVGYSLGFPMVKAPNHAMVEHVVRAFLRKMYLFFVSVQWYPVPNVLVSKADQLLLWLDDIGGVHVSVWQR